MDVGLLSKAKFYSSFESWVVPEDFAEPIYNYFVYGLPMGSCLDNLFANDAFGTITHSHPANTINSFKTVVSWLYHLRSLYGIAYGSHEAVHNWLSLDESVRRDYLVRSDLILDAHDETIRILKGETAFIPMLIPTMKE